MKGSLYWTNLHTENQYTSRTAFAKQLFGSVGWRATNVGHTVAMTHGLMGVNSSAVSPCPAVRSREVSVNLMSYRVSP